MTKHFKKMSEEIIHQNPWWEYKHDVFEYPDGEQSDYYYGQNHGSVMVIPMLDDGRLVLVSQYRYLRGKINIEFPRGGIGEGEPPQTGAERELIEETGYKSSNYIKVGSFDSLPGIFKDTTHVFFADELNQTSVPTPDKSEALSGMQILYRRPDEFEDMIRRGEIWDGQTLAAWAMARDRVMQKLHRL
ncbi:MAG: NUDIX hydrolase [bacterium]|nr:NUDIX hydrolase [bacterium]